MHKTAKNLGFPPILFWGLFWGILFCGISTAHAELQTSAIAEHKIKSGENLYIIARQYNVDVRNLIRANRLKPPYVIRIGDSLQIPGAPYHVVKSGETLSFIAREYDVGLRSLVVLNKIKPPYVIRLKQKIYIPTPDSTAKKTTKADVTKAVENAAKAAVKKITEIIPAPLPPHWKPDEAPSDKVDKGQVSASRAPLPRNWQPDEVKVSASRAPLPPTRAPDNKPADKPAPDKPDEKIARAPIPSDLLSDSPSPAPTAITFSEDFIDNGASFLPPVKGKIISRFGKQELGVYNDGINFATDSGKPVRSARDGEVVYSDNSLKRLGNLILIRHQNGYMTAYAHNERNLVQRGQRVKRGQVIAIVGNSGGVKRPQLHFQIRKGGKILNPEKYIGGS